jgi:hypothetical protein
MSTIHLPAVASKKLPAVDVPKLSSGAEACISAMDIKDHTDYEIVYLVLGKQRKPSGFCNVLEWVIYHIKQAVRSIFGNSHWQLARNIVAARIVQLAKTNNTPSRQNPILNLDSQKSLDKISKSTAESLMRLAAAFDKGSEEGLRERSSTLKELAALSPYLSTQVLDRMSTKVINASNKGSPSRSTISSASK